jgi:hypothetical protein
MTPVHVAAIAARGVTIVPVMSRRFLLPHSTGLIRCRKRCCRLPARSKRLLLSPGSVRIQDYVQLWPDRL